MNFTLGALAWLGFIWADLMQLVRGCLPQRITEAFLWCLSELPTQDTCDVSEPGRCIWTLNPRDPQPIPTPSPQCGERTEWGWFPCFLPQPTSTFSVKLAFHKVNVSPLRSLLSVESLGCVLHLPQAGPTLVLKWASAPGRRWLHHLLQGPPHSALPVGISSETFYLIKIFYLSFFDVL